MSGAFATTIAQSLLGKLGSFAGQEFCLAWGLEADIARLEKRMKAINAVLSDAEQKQSKNERIRLWLNDLTEVLYDAEDVLDEIACETLRRQVVKTTGSTSRKLLQGSAESLQIFIIRYCPNIEEMPDCIGNLNKLQNLEISDCPSLSKRCQKGTGEDWPKVAHIPKIKVDGDDSGEETSHS
ncbi:hypothetical protein H0E87_027718, partial [Populus deltoides]